MANYIITKVDIIPIQIELNEPFVISVGALSHAQNTVVLIHTQDAFGTGECCRVRTIYAETQEGVIAIGKKLAPALIGKQVSEIHKLVQMMDAIHPGYSSIKSAIDMALYDLNAKLVGLPLYKFLNGHRGKKIVTDMTVGLHSQEEMVEKAVRCAESGFTSIKIKLGKDPVSDVGRVAAIRNAVGNDISLRIDANQGWNYVQASTALRGMVEYDLEYCEAPIHARNFVDRKRLRDEQIILLMGDESIFNHHDVYQNLMAGTIDMVNIKLGKSGGICQAMKIASMTEAANMYCQVGCFSESRLGITALAHFSMVWDHIVYHDMDSPLMQSLDPVLGGLTYTKDWEVLVGEEPGHGAIFDERFLGQFGKLTFHL